MTTLTFAEPESAFYMPDNKNSDEKLKVPISVAADAGKVTAKTTFESQIFSDWANQYSKSKDYVLKDVSIKKAEMTDDHITSLTFDISSHNVSDDTTINTSVCLNQKKTIMLILIRDEDQKKEHLVFTQQSDPAMGNAHYYAIPRGNFDSEGKFVCKSIADLETKIGFPVEQSECINLTQMAFNGSHIVFPTQGQAVEMADVYLYKRGVTSTQLSELQTQLKKDTDEKTPCSLVLKTLNDSWSSTVDPRSMCAIFLLHELRHHGRMANALPNKDGRKKGSDMPITKRKPQFIHVSQLDPYSNGSNLLVKVHSGPTNESERTKNDGSIVKEAQAVVGDQTGLVTIRLVNEQINEISVGAKILIQNVKIDMVENRIVLGVDQWGKITSDAAVLEEHDFNFEINVEKDLSKQEYELVMLNENSSHNNYRDSRGRGRGRPRGPYRRGNRRH